MAKYVPDIKTQRWVIISQARTKRPDDAGAKKSEIKPKESVCPFCAGNEHSTPPEVYRIGPGGKEEPGWQVRVVPNKFPITDTHEVFIHSPVHEHDLEALPLDQVVRIVSAYRDRFRAHDSDGQVLIFCNHGKGAGASLAHPHSQLVVVPKQINLDSVSREPIANTVEESKDFISYCPDFSQWPYETWIAPTEEGEKFGDIRDRAIEPLAGILQRSLQRIQKAYEQSIFYKKDAPEPFVFNYYIYHGTNWFIRIIPRFVHRAGFELGTGLNVNIIDPTAASQELQATLL